MKRTILIGCLELGACTALGLAPNLAADCNAQAAIIQQATSMIGKLLTAERATIDAQKAISDKYCQGALPTDPTVLAAESKAIETSTANISAVLALATLRK